MPMISLEPSRYVKRHRFSNKNCVAVKKSLPFAESLRGEYTHRVRHVTLYVLDGKSHFAVNCWCGMSMCFGGKNSKGMGGLYENPSAGRPMCATCEGRAIGAGLLGSREIAGRPVMYRAIRTGGAA